MPAGCGLGADGRRLPAALLPAGCRADQGEAFIFSGNPGDHEGGASGLLRTLSLPGSDQMPAPCGGIGAGSVSCGTFGLSPQGVGDLTGDGVVDQYINALSFNYDTATDGACANPSAATCVRGQGAIYLFNGATGALIRRTDDPVPQAGVQSGAQDAEPLGDVDGACETGPVTARRAVDTDSSEFVR